MKETIMSAADQLRQEGHNQGLKQGIQQERLIIATNMLHKGADDAFISEMTGISVELLAKIKDDLHQ